MTNRGTKIFPVFRFVWGVLLVGMLTAYLWSRLADLRNGRSSPLDVLVFLVWFAILLSPLYREVDLLGVVKLKRELDDMRFQLSQQLLSIRSDLQNSITVQPQISPVFSFGSPPPASELPRLKEDILRTIEDRYGIRPQEAKGVVPDVPDDVKFLFAVRRGKPSYGAFMLSAVEANHRRAHRCDFWTLWWRVGRFRET